MEYTEIMLGMIFTLAGTIFGVVIALNFKFDKLQKTINEMKTLTEK